MSISKIESTKLFAKAVEKQQAASWEEYYTTGGVGQYDPSSVIKLIKRNPKVA